MQDKPKSNKNIIVIGIVILLIGIAGYMYVTRDQSVSQTLTVASAGSVVTPVDSDLLSALNSLKKLKLDDSIFKNPVWLSLVDFGKVLAPQEKFRPNPFAPLTAGTSTLTAAR